MRIDLHMHSTFSDGVLTPTVLVDRAVGEGLSLISLTDHDCVDGLPEAIQAGKKRGVEVVPGVELSCEFRERDLHVLGYGVDPHDATFRKALQLFQETRHKRGIKIIEKLNALGINIEPAEVLAKAGKGALGRPHVAAVLVDKGVVSTTSEAFDKYIAEGGPAYVPKYKMSAREAIDLIRRAGGLAFIAHPGVFLENKAEIYDLVAMGFDGIEVYHPKHSATRAEELRRIAEERRMLVSGGSDFHGFSGRDVMGTQDVPYSVWEKIRDALESKRTHGGQDG
jgi:predicted metal-dependent phosphoesterase TrpH